MRRWGRSSSAGAPTPGCRSGARGRSSTHRTLVYDDPPRRDRRRGRSPDREHVPHPPADAREGGLWGEGGELTALAVRLAREAADGAGRDALRRRLALPAGGLLPARPRPGGQGARARARRAGRVARGRRRRPHPPRNPQRRSRARRGGAGREGDRIAVHRLHGDRRGRPAPFGRADRRGGAGARAGRLEPDVLSINCVPAGGRRADLGRLCRGGSGRPLGAYGNLGLPADDRGWSFTEELSPEAYAKLARGWLALGARIVGGCCGTSPAHTAALRYAISIASPKE